MAVPILRQTLAKLGCRNQSQGITCVKEGLFGGLLGVGLYLFFNVVVDIKYVKL